MSKPKIESLPDEELALFLKYREYSNQLFDGLILSLQNPQEKVMLIRLVDTLSKQNKILYSNYDAE